MNSNIHIHDPNPDGSMAVLLLHGLGANGSSWSLQFEPLIKAGFRPIAPDLPGFGASPYDGSGWNFNIIACNLANLINDLNLRSVHVVGLSMGGVIAQQFALDYPMLVQKLVLVSTFSELRPTNLSQWIYFAVRGIVVHTTGLKSQSKIVARRIFPGADQEYLRKLAEEQISSADVRAYRAAMRSLALFNTSKHLKQINTPVLVISGENDSTIPPILQQKLAHGIVNARQVIIPKAGHAVAIDQYAPFNKNLLDFLQS